MAKKRVYKPRQFCSIADSECLSPAGYRSAMGVHHNPRPSVLWECSACGNPACKNCRGAKGGKTVCAHCVENE